MTEEMPERAVRAFDAADAFESVDRGFAVTTTRFDAHVIATETDEWALSYTLEVRAPMLSSATADPVGPAVEEGWFETYELRLEDAPRAVRDDVELSDHRVLEEAGEAVAVFEFEHGNADRAPAIAKAITEYVEGTYMEGIVPGYDYGPPVSEMLSRARSSGGEDGSGPMPL